MEQETTATIELITKAGRVSRRMEWGAWLCFLFALNVHPQPGPITGWVVAQIVGSWVLVYSGAALYAGAAKLKAEINECGDVQGASSR